MSDMSSVTLENLVSVAEAAKRLGVSRIQVHHYIRSGRLRAAKIGARWVIEAASLDAFAKHRPARGNPEFGPNFWKRRKKVRKPA